MLRCWRFVKGEKEGRKKSRRGVRWRCHRYSVQGRKKRRKRRRRKTKEKKRKGKEKGEDVSATTRSSSSSLRFVQCGIEGGYYGCWQSCGATKGASRGVKGAVGAGALAGGVRGAVGAIAGVWKGRAFCAIRADRCPARPRAKAKPAAPTRNPLALPTTHIPLLTTLLSTHFTFSYVD